MAKFVSAICLPFSVLLAKNTSCGAAPLGLNADPTLSKNLFNLSLLYASSLPRFPSSLNATPVPNTNPVKV